MPEAIEHHQYPMMMSHPHYRPAINSTEPGKGSPIYKPPVTVHTKDQENYHSAQGYIPNGKSNPAAFVQAHASPEASYQKHEYPKYVGDIVVNNEDEEFAALERNEQMAAEAEAARLRAEVEAAKPATPDVEDRVARLEDGMSKLLDAVLALKPVAPEAPASNVDAVRAMFVEKAKGIGLKIDGRWSLEQLIKQCADAEARGGASADAA